MVGENTRPRVEAGLVYISHSHGSVFHHQPSIFHTSSWSVKTRDYGWEWSLAYKSYPACFGVPLFLTFLKPKIRENSFHHLYLLDRLSVLSIKTGSPAINNMQLQPIPVPDFTIVDTFSHSSPEDDARLIILHTPSMSLIEVVDLADEIYDPIILDYQFDSASAVHGGSKVTYPMPILKSCSPKLGIGMSIISSGMMSRSLRRSNISYHSCFFNFRTLIED